MYLSQMFSLLPSLLSLVSSYSRLHLLLQSVTRELMLEMVEYAERVPKVNNGNMWKDSEVLRSIVWLFILLTEVI